MSTKWTPTTEQKEYFDRLTTCHYCKKDRDNSGSPLSLRVYERKDGSAFRVCRDCFDNLPVIEQERIEKEGLGYQHRHFNIQ